MIIFGSQNITDAAIDDLSSFKDQLVTIDLRGTAITDEGLTLLQSFRSLSRVWIADTKVTKIGVDRLQLALPKCNIYSDFTKTSKS